MSGDEILRHGLGTDVAIPKTHFSLFSYKFENKLYFNGIFMFINSHTVHIHDYQFSFYGKVTGNFKKPLLFLVCL